MDNPVRIMWNFFNSIMLGNLYLWVPPRPQVRSITWSPQIIEVVQIPGDHFLFSNSKKDTKVTRVTQDRVKEFFISWPTPTPDAPPENSVLILIRLHYFLQLHSTFNVFPMATVTFCHFLLPSISGCSALAERLHHGPSLCGVRWWPLKIPSISIALTINKRIGDW